MTMASRDCSERSPRAARGGGRAPVRSAAYPLDGYDETGIRRLDASRLADEGVGRT